MRVNVVQAMDVRTLASAWIIPIVPQAFPICPRQSSLRYSISSDDMTDRLFDPQDSGIDRMLSLLKYCRIFRLPYNLGVLSDRKEEDDRLDWLWDHCQ